jgi:hypothetical protein
VHSIRFYLSCWGEGLPDRGKSFVVPMLKFLASTSTSACYEDPSLSWLTNGISFSVVFFVLLFLSKVNQSLSPPERLNEAARRVT